MRDQVLLAEKMIKERFMSTRNIINPLFLALTLVGASLPAAAQADSASKPIPEVAHNTWSSGAPMPTAVNWPTTGVIKGKIYVVSGYAGGAPAVTDNQVYNPVTNSWTSAAPIPAATGQGTGAVVKNILYVFGGSNNGGGTVFNTVWAYNPKTNEWTSKAAMPTARCSATAVVADNIIYVIGGYNGSRLNVVEAYNPATDSWTEKADLLLGKSEISAGVFGTAKTGFTIVAADGFSGSDTGDNEAYDVATNKWKSLSSDPDARNGSCFGIISGKLYASDGNASGNNPIAVMEAFNLKKDAWTSLATMPNTLTDSGSAVYKGRLYCIGGGNNAVPPNNTVYNYVQIYQP
jgi:N-acetylneuraminic acid mutarotase